MQNCDGCLKKNLWQSSQYWTDEQRWWRCRNCGHWQLEVPPQGLKIAPKILYFDIERSLMTFYSYERAVRSGYLPKEWIRQEAFIICWAAGWIGGKVIKSACVTQAEALRRDDRRVLQELWHMLDSADIITGHNVTDFDYKKVNQRFLVHEMGVPSVGKVMDTLKMAKKHFPFESNSLEYISTHLGGRPKKEINLADWIRIVETGDPATLRKAERYCKGDVREGVYVFNRFVDHIQSSGTQVYK